AFAARDQQAHVSVERAGRGHRFEDDVACLPDAAGNFDRDRARRNLQAAHVIVEAEQAPAVRAHAFEDPVAVKKSVVGDGQFGVLAVHDTAVDPDFHAMLLCGLSSSSRPAISAAAWTTRSASAARRSPPARVLGAAITIEPSMFPRSSTGAATTVMPGIHSSRLVAQPRLRARATSRSRSLRALVVWPVNAGHGSGGRVTLSGANARCSLPTALACTGTSEPIAGATRRTERPSLLSRTTMRPRRAIVRNAVSPVASDSRSSTACA